MTPRLRRGDDDVRPSYEVTNQGACPEGEKIMDASFIQDLRGPIHTAPAFSLPGTSSILGATALVILAEGRPAARLRRWLEWWRQEEAWPRRPPAPAATSARRK